MSTLCEIQALIDKGQLYEFVPFGTDPDFCKTRTIYFSQEVHQMCPSEGRSKVKNAPSGATMDACRALLEQFIGGDELEEGIDLKLLHPKSDNIWELRVAPSPPAKHIRFLGWFLSFNVFVVTHMEFREDLRDGESEAWKKTIEKVGKKRENIYSTLSVFYPGTQAQDYVSNCIPEFKGG